MQNFYTITEISHGTSDPVTPWVVVFKTSAKAIETLVAETDVPQTQVDDFQSYANAVGDDGLFAGHVHTFEHGDKEYMLTKVEVR